MRGWQKYIIHPLTALAFAFAVAQFIYQYELVDFSYAWLLSAGIVFVSYLFLARRYDPSLSLIFLGLAGFIFYQAVTLAEKKVEPVALTHVAKQKLYVLNALVRHYQAVHGHLPQTLEELPLQALKHPELEFYFCQKPGCLPEKGLAEMDYHLMVQSKDQQVLPTVITPDYTLYE